MPTEFDNLPDEEIPVPGLMVSANDPAFNGLNDYLEMYRDILHEAYADSQDLLREFRVGAGVNLKDVEWLRAYLDPDSSTCNQPWGAAKAVGIKKTRVPGLMRRYEPIIRKWFDDLRYGELQVKQVVAKWFDAKDAPKIQTVKGKVNQDVLPTGTRVLAETDDETTLITELEHTGQLKAAELASKHLGMLTDKVEHKLSIEDALRALRGTDNGNK